MNFSKIANLSKKQQISTEKYQQILAEKRSKFQKKYQIREKNSTFELKGSSNLLFSAKKKTANLNKKYQQSQLILAKKVVNFSEKLAQFQLHLFLMQKLKKLCY